MRLEPVTEATTRDRLLRGEDHLASIAPGWPHTDTAAGMSFIDRGGWVFLIIDDDDRIAGECGTKTPPNADGAVEIGYGLAAPSRGRGLGTAAVQALVAKVAADDRVSVIEAEVDDHNESSWRILQRLGFEPTDVVAGRFRRYRLELPH